MASACLVIKRAFCRASSLVINRSGIKIENHPIIGEKCAETYERNPRWRREMSARQVAI